MGIDGYRAGYAGLNACFARKVHVRYNTSVEQYHISRLDAQAACCFDAGNVSIASDQRQDSGSDRKPDAKALHFVLDDLRHVPVNARQNLRLAF